MHTLETLLALADDWEMHGRVRLKAALQEVLAERDEGYRALELSGKVCKTQFETIEKLMAERDANALDAARFRYISELCCQVGRDSEKIVRLIGTHQHLDALIADQHVAKGQTP